MTPDRWLVLVGGFALIALIVWFFWMKRSSGVRASVGSSGYQEAMILVKGGYTPDTIVVRAGQPVRLNFRREETASRSASSAGRTPSRSVAFQVYPNRRVALATPGRRSTTTNQSLKAASLAPRRLRLGSTPRTLTGTRSRMKSEG